MNRKVWFSKTSYLEPLDRLFEVYPFGIKTVETKEVVNKDMPRDQHVLTTGTRIYL